MTKYVSDRTIRLRMLITVLLSWAFTGGWSYFYEKEPLLIIISVIITIGVGLFFFASWFDESQVKAPARKNKPYKVAANPDSPRNLGYKISWIAIATEDVHKVCKAMGLTDLELCNWETGLQFTRIHEWKFITPPVSGFVLIVSSSLPELGPDFYKNGKRFLQGLGTHFEDVYFFASYRNVDYYAWAHVKNGQINRAYSYQGDVVIDTGEPDEIELVDSSPTEADVLEIAELWTINPNTIEAMGLPNSVGYIGR